MSPIDGASAGPRRRRRNRVRSACNPRSTWDLEASPLGEIVPGRAATRRRNLRARLAARRRERRHRACFASFTPAMTDFPIYLFILIVFLNRYVFGLYLA